MPEVPVRDLRNHGGRVLDRVAGGETLIITRDGRPVAELRPLRKQPTTAPVLLNRWRSLPALDPTKLRADIDAVVNPAL